MLFKTCSNNSFKILKKIYYNKNKLNRYAIGIFKDFNNFSLISLKMFLFIIL